MPPPQQPLPDELLEEIFLRLPPDEPSSLVRASLVSKPWIGLFTGPRFRGRYRQFHGSPPMLGFLYVLPWINGSKEKATVPPFVSTTNFCARTPDNKDWMDAVSDYTAWDCRHGRVLLCDTRRERRKSLVVWDPMTGCWSRLEAPEDYDTQWATVLCAVSGCDHRACHEGPFRVVFVGLDYIDDACVAYAHVSLPYVGEWSKPCSTLDLVAERAFLVSKPPAFILEALYFMLTYRDDDDINGDDLLDGGGDDDPIAILKYDLGSNCLSLIDAPPQKTNIADEVILMAMEDGRLGFAHLDNLILTVWSRQMASDRLPAWTQCIVINLNELLAIQLYQTRPIGSVECSDIIFVTNYFGTYEINLKSLKWKKLRKRELRKRGEIDALIPYMSFYNPPVKNLCLQEV